MKIKCHRTFSITEQDPCEKFVAEALQNFIKSMADGHMRVGGEKEKKIRMSLGTGKKQHYFATQTAKLGLGNPD